MRRHAPEDHDTLPPLFAHAEKVAAANRAEVGMARAAGRAERVRPGWHADALAAVRLHAETHAHFLAEDVDAPVPSEADPRAFGAVMREAVRAGICVADGAAPANSSNRSLKTRWRSLIHVPAGEPVRS